MNKFNQDWNKYHLSIDNIDLYWSDVDELSYYATLQSGQFGQKDKLFSKQTFFEEFPKFYQKMWDLNSYLSVYNDLSDNAKILDIGSGIAVIDLLIAKKYPNSKIFLLDKGKEDVELKQNVFYSNDYFFYNSWDPVIDCINNSNITNTEILNITDEWPNDLDLITSYFSWCMHYPKETYWKLVKEKLKPNGKLVIDVRNLKDRNVIEEISEEFCSKPKKFEFKNTIPEWIDNYSSDTLGWRCVWERVEK
jgi:SAM-dependent methyltransferase